jgi:salicylate hydroxylase
MTIGIVGAGIGGAAAAVTVRRAGHDVVVFEQAHTIEEVGAGVVITPNSARLLGEIGALRRLDGQAVRPHALHIRRWRDGRTIVHQNLNETDARFGAPYLTVHRADLLGAISTAIPPENIRLDHRLIALTQDDTGVRLKFANGREETVDAVIGADGVRSTVSQAIGIPTHPRASGYAAYRGLIPAEALAEVDVEPNHTTWLGPDHHLVHYWVAGGSLLNFVAIVPSFEGTESWSREGDLDVARREFADWAPRARIILDRAENATRIGLWGLFDRPTRDHWAVGRVTVMGDAAHPMLPFFAQGAGQALEDASTLGVLLEDATPATIGERLAIYEAHRVPRVRRVQDLSKRNATLFHLPDGPEQQVRDARLAGIGVGDPLTDRAWLFGYDARTEAAVALHTLA